jgi:molybdenum cofactor biosynthesis protein MoaC
MVDITHKSNTLREAIAQAIVRVSSQETIDAIVNKTVPKGDVFEMAKTAGLFAVKRTSDMLPDCHPLPVEYTGVSYEIHGLEVHIRIEVKTVYKTGVEVEAMHGASVIALTMYDMLKPIDKGVEIFNIKLLSKKGGKTSFKDGFERPLRTAVIVCSDSVSSGAKTDRSGKIIIEKLKAYPIEVTAYDIVPDNASAIETKFAELHAAGNDLLIFTGGTGLSPKDITPDTLGPLLDREVPGIMEAARKYGQDRTPYAMLSRGLCGVKDKTLVLAIPGSSKGAAETIDALFPALLHSFKALEVTFKH